MSAAPVNIALVGVGGYGQRHLRIIKELVSRNLVKLTAAADPFFDSREASARRRLETEGTRCYLDYRTMLDKEGCIDLLVLVTPIPLHAEMIERCLDYGMKIYLEKPPVPTIQQLERLIALDKHERITVGFQMIAMETITRLKRWIDEGKLGEIHHIAIGANWPRRDLYYKRAEWVGQLVMNGSPVFDGPATNGLAHLIQNIMLLSNQGVNRFWEPVSVRAGFYRARPIKSYDLASFRGAFSNGVEFTAVLSHCSENLVPWKMRINGTKGAAWIDRDGTSLRTNVGLDFETAPEHRADPLLEAAFSFYRETLAWVKEGQRRSLVNLSDCRGYLKTVCGGLLSSQGVHSIDREFLEIRGKENDRIYHVNGLAEGIRTSLDKLSPLEDLDLFPWTRKGSQVDLTNLDCVPMEGFDAYKLQPSQEMELSRGFPLRMP